MDDLKPVEVSPESLPARTDTAGGQFDLVPRNLTEAMEFAKLIAKTSLVPKSYRDDDGKVNPGDILVAVQYGMEVGLKPLQAIQNIAVINGNPTIWGDAALGLIQASGLLESHKERNAEDSLKAGAGRCCVKRKGDPETADVTFSMDMAKQANLLSKPPWRAYPGRMLQMRARSWALREKFADVLKGLQFREEINDIPLKEAAHQIVEPQRKSSTEKLVDEFIVDTASGEKAEQTEATPGPWTGKIASIASSGDKKNPRYAITAEGGRTFHTFDKKIGKFLEEAGPDLEVEIQWEKTQYGRKVTSAEPAKTEEPSEEA